MTNPEKISDYLTVGEAARFIGVSSATLRKWDRGGKLIAYRHPVNGYRLYARGDLELLLQEVKQNAKTKES